MIAKYWHVIGNLLLLQDNKLIYKLLLWSGDSIFCYEV